MSLIKDKILIKNSKKIINRDKWNRKVLHLSIKMKDLPEAERPYEKLELYGEKNLTNAELLAIIIKTGTKEETSVQVAQHILKLNKSNSDTLEFLGDIGIQEFMKIKGIRKSKSNTTKSSMRIGSKNDKANKL